MRAAQEVVGPLIARLKGAPHRDASHVPFGEWLRLYVGVRKAILAPGYSTVPTGDIERAAKLLVNCALLSSVWAQRWSDVVVVPPKEASSVAQVDSAGGSAWWLQPPPSLLQLPSKSCGNDSPGFDLLTPSFATEPSQGGRFVAQRLSEIRSSDRSGASSSTITHRVILPFSTALEIKREAFHQFTSGRAGQRVTPALSLQERTSRIALLSSLSQVLQLQSYVVGTGRHLPVEVALMLPTDEMDALHELPSVRLTAPPHVQQQLTLKNVCEIPVARLAYLALYLEYRQQVPVVVLASNVERPVYVACGAPRVHSHENCGDPRTLQATPSRASLHSQVVEGCGGLVRRLRRREENLRQSASKL